MNSRRKFIKTAGFGSALVAVNPYSIMSIAEKGRLKKIGFISGILNKNFETEDWKIVLKKAVEYGFTEYEGGVKGDSSAEFLKYCKEIGLKPVAGGVGMSDDMDKIQQDLEKLNELEMKYAVTYWPWLVGAPFKTDDCRRSAELLNRIGERAKKNGLIFCWHNHDREFDDMETGKPFDYLIENTEKELVNCEMDIYWVAKGGADPLEVLKKYKGRIPVLHVKDMADDQERSFACPGSGIIDFPAVFAEAEKQNIEHYFVERDNAPDGLTCLKSSGEYLRDLRF
jgi:sugar phosphate isomerase/epimerase